MFQRGLRPERFSFKQEGEARGASLAPPAGHWAARASAWPVLIARGYGGRWPAARSVASGTLWGKLIIHNFDPQLYVSSHLSTVLNNKLLNIVPGRHTSICMTLDILI